MSQLPVTSTSTWNHQQIVDFLQGAVIPMRLAVNEQSGFPRICSLWFTLDGQDIVAATHEKSLVAQLLKNDNRCAFEIATNTEPYHGVRGQARASLLLEEGKSVLPRLIKKYIDNRHPRLQTWLLSRINEEYAIRLHIEWISAWDYSSRMQASA
jgi:hypothetical protein